MCVCVRVSVRERERESPGMQQWLVNTFSSPWKLCQHSGGGGEERKSVNEVGGCGVCVCVCDLLLGRRYLTLVLHKSPIPSQHTHTHTHARTHADVRAVRSLSESLSSSVDFHSVIYKTFTERRATRETQSVTQIAGEERGRWSISHSQTCLGTKGVCDAAWMIIYCTADHYRTESPQASLTVMRNIQIPL